MDRIDAELAVLDAQQAEAVLNNPVWLETEQRMKDYLHRKRMDCKTTNPELAADIIRCEQLLEGMYREMKRVMENGKIGKIKLVELEKHNRPKVFRR